MGILSKRKEKLILSLSKLLANFLNDELPGSVIDEQMVARTDKVRISLALVGLGEYQYE